MKLNKKLITMALAVCIVMSMAVCFAAGETGQAGFVAAVTDSSTGITSTAMWDNLTLIVPLIVGMFIFAFGFGRIRYLLSKGSKGKFKM